MAAPEPFLGPDGRPRCFWTGGAPEFLAYHDEEWGFPVADDTRLFEKLCLEGFQSGLSWRTILNKRENFRAAFAGFDLSAVARFDDRDRARLLEDAGIVRHRGKIDAALNNARRALDVVDEFGSLAAYVWRFEPAAESRPPRVTQAWAATAATSPESKAMAKELKKRGWAFVGPTTVYAFMQSMGLVNDHTEDCVVRERCEAARRRFERPS
ncbi:MAG: DNA-3-methyladenine glycosylase I [Planctomycetota bacterium]